MTIDRRDFLSATALAIGSTALLPMLGTTAASAKPATEPKSGQVPSYYKTKVGSAIVTAMLDGNGEFGNELFTKADEDMLERAKADYFLTRGKPFPSFVNTYLVQTGGKNILIDTGAQGFAPTMGHTKPLLKTIADGADRIDEIILTHGHPDHINGLLDDKGGIAFKKAVVKISEPELAFWYDDAQMANAGGKKGMFEGARKTLDPYKKSGQLQTYKFDGDLGHGLASVALPGHTPGHSGVMVADGGEQLLIWADIVHNAYLQFDYPEQTLSFDTDEEQARKTRLKILDRVAGEKLRIGGMHLPFTALGHVAKRGKAYAFVPQRWEGEI